MSIILVVDDDTAHRTMLRTLLKGWTYEVDEADDGSVAVEKVHTRPYDAVLMDIRMVRMGGIEALRGMKAFNPAIPVLIMTAFSSVETAVEALKIGAYDYLTKPLDFDVLRLTLERMLDHTRLASENRTLRERLEGRGHTDIVGKSAAMLELAEMIHTVAPTDATVLISGESGTGKELVAHAIHAASARAEKPFVAVNCAALTDTLLESELFGHERGAFTGADKRREGRFMQADGGTLFLDEIGEIPLLLQSKLLRALQQGEVQRVGSDTVLNVNVRVIAATNRDLFEEVQAGTFREDLYYRLNVIGLRVPPLRERRDDIPLLADFFLRRFAEKNRKMVKGATPQAMDALVRHDWPGNVRELENAMERAVIMTTGEYITLRELPRNLSDAPLTDVPISATGEPALAGLSLDELERRAIMATLKECGDNKSEAARRLGITRATLHNKLRRYGME
ncbi:sigma-54-dependent transcriptional regulator [Desulfovibrio psychrotolerans]|uniref:Acetoacetate metabolism regulatory protein AtoC n=1 Tax=Desulfovibrio psychrotolerans TaxID=415242 RepID=A0A7J0BY42_9BACT|nr:sigma-54 dependent transcriptional regulator [Desulfovibrio psychrotolerans]GFM38603.1 acetoacetate metabolism regulatory protein AtoC [Desulfovibrio psychrotolerans]